MRVSAIAMLALLLIGCDWNAPAGGIFEPVKAAPAVVVAGPAAAPMPVPEGSFDFVNEDRTDEEGDGTDVDAAALQARLYGVDPNSDAAQAPAPAPKVQPAAATPTAVAGSAIAMPLWEPNAPIGGSWGLRLLATVHDVQPPRAMIALPDGTELVVQPGQMLPEHHLVVLAIGQNAIQVARVTPQGFYAKVETETVTSMFQPTPTAPR